MPQVIINIADGSCLPHCHKHINVAQIKQSWPYPLFAIQLIIGTKNKNIESKHIFKQ